MFKDNPKLKNIFFAGFLLSLHFALTAYVNSSFLSLFIEEKTVGLVYTAGYIVSILALLLVPKILRLLGGYKFLLGAAGLNAVALLVLSSSKDASLIIPTFIVYLALNTSIVFALDELLQIFSKHSGVGKVRGVLIATMSFAWVIAQAASGAILNHFSFPVLYLISSFLMFIFFIFSFIFFRGLPDPKYDRAPILKSLKTFFKHKALVRSYKINFLLQFFYAVMVIYTPIYLSAHIGFSWSEIGLIFTIMLTPFVLLPSFLGKYSDQIGERKMLIIGFAIAAAATFSLFFVSGREVWVWALALFATRLGAATIETMSDVHFFKHIALENDEFVGIYRNAAPAAYVLAPLFAFVVFTLTPAFNFIYLFLGAFMLAGAYVASTIRRNDK